MAKIKVRILFYIRNNKINVYEYKNCKFESIQDCGEDEIEYSENFMNWFKGAIAYLKGMQELDYLIITDNSVELDYSDFDIANESFWNKGKIREFNTAKLTNQGLVLRNIANREYYRFNVGRNSLEYTVIFCDKNVNRNLQEKKEVKKDKGVKLPKKEDKLNLACKSQVDKNIKLKKEEDNPKRQPVELNEEIAATQNVVLNKDINITEYYKRKLKKEEEERNKMKSNF